MKNFVILLRIVPLFLLFLDVPKVNSGFACLTNPCVHGVCVDDLNSTYLCYCIDGYTGIHCQTNWNECWSNPCKNGASCIDGIATFNCTCTPGYTGEFCEIDLNECESNPCLNNATCLDGINGYMCNCQTGYFGDHCEIDVAVCNSTNETRCANGAICEEGPGETFNCKCLPGWTGNLCETEINECLSNPCQNGAVCVDLLADYVCACTFGFMGKNCEEETKICESDICRNNALCLIEDNQPVCYCVPDFHGDLCQFQYDECQLGVRCYNGGSCIDGVDNFTCSCRPRFSGKFCECFTQIDGFKNCSFTDFYEFTTSIYTTSDFMSTISGVSISISVETSKFPSSSWTETSSIFSSEPSTNTDEFFSTKETEKVTLTTLEMTSKTDIISSTNYETTTEMDIVTTSSPEIEMRSTTSTEPQDNFTSTSSSTEKTKITEFPVPTSDFSPLITTELEITTIGIETTSVPISSEITSEVPISTQSTEEITTSTTEKIVTKLLVTAEPEESQTAVGTEEITTQSLNFTTAPIPTPNECSLIKNDCLNGGTCIISENGFRCRCPFNTEGPFCETMLGMKNVAFSGYSYLVHRINNLANVTFEFEAITVASTGLIFHLISDSIFMSLYMKNGFLEFKFSCSFQTMLLKELKTLVNRGYPINIRAELKFSKDLIHCEASVSVNNTLSMKGDQIANLTQFSKSAVWLYFGGVQPELKNSEKYFTSGFAGCMKNLKISGRKVNIFGDAENASGVQECSSLACLSNPCTNDGTCFVVESGDWSCHCKNGFLGRGCENSVCDNNPCLFGGTCVSLESGHICLCPYGKHGQFCENDIKLSKPQFSAMAKGWSSYISYSLPNKLSRNVEIKFKIIPSDLDQISLVLFMGQTGYHDMFSDHLAVSFIKGYIMMTWNLGSGPRRIFTNQPIQKNQEVCEIHLGLRRKRGWLYVENIGNITGRSPGAYENLDVEPVLFIGGHESRYFNKLPHDLPQHSGFLGCIFDVKLRIEDDFIPVKHTWRTTGRAVNQCGVSECYKNRCPNMSACLHHGSTFTCLCQDSWYGPLCMSKINPCDFSNNKCSASSKCVPLIEGYECDCPYGKIGKFCEKNVNITDVSFTGTRSYLKLIPSEFKSNRFNIKLEIKPLSNDGLILSIGDLDHFICLSLYNGALELRAKRGKQKISHNLAIVKSSTLLAKGIWHSVHFGIFGRKVYLNVENVINSGLMEKDTHTLEITENIYLGGLPDLSNLPLDAVSSYPVFYTGCIRGIEIDSRLISIDPKNVVNGQNLVDCDGTACGGEVCRNGGTCWLDSLNESHCNCPSPFYGTRCEEMVNCTKSLCNNNGTCEDNKCSCIPGRNGFFCENEIAVRVPNFRKDSFLIVDEKHDKKRGALKKSVDQISINFTTANDDGLLLWQKENNYFLGIGVEKGHLKMVYSTDVNNTFSAVLWNHFISDGLWHNVLIEFSPWNIEIDNKLITNKNIPLFQSVSVNAKFFLGNVPTNKSLHFETNGFFDYPFEGCIESFTQNLRKIVDFTKYEGMNLDVCHIL